MQIPRNTADNPLRITDASSKMLRARCKQGIQGQNALNTMQIAYLIPKPCKQEISAAKNAQSTDSEVVFQCLKFIFSSVESKGEPIFFPPIVDSFSLLN